MATSVVVTNNNDISFITQSPQRITHFSCNSCGCTVKPDQLVTVFRILRELEEVSLPRFRGINPTIMEAIGQLPRLQKLDLTDTDVDGAGLAKLVEAGSVEHTLTSLFLSQCSNVNDIGLKAISSLTQLVVLELKYCSSLLEKSLAHLRNITTLRWLMLDGFSGLSSSCLEQFMLPQDQPSPLSLTALGLAGTQIGNAGVQNISKITSLRDLNLRSTKITDPAGDFLRGLRNLRTLDTACTNFSNKARKGLEDHFKKSLGTIMPMPA